MITTIINVIAVILVIAVIIGMYNKLVRLRNEADSAKADIATQLQRRYDLIPNLIETVKGYAKHESKVLTEVTAQRQSMMKPGAGSTIKDLEASDAQLNGMMGRLIAVSESYPDLKASTNFSQLQEELTSTENKISFARQNYNDRVYEYNTGIQTFPNSLIAGMFNFTKKDLFEVSNPAATAPVRVSFNDE